MNQHLSLPAGQGETCQITANLEPLFLTLGSAPGNENPAPAATGSGANNESINGGKSYTRPAPTTTEKRAPRTALPMNATREQIALWRAMPYGMWTCGDGREVLFDRNYNPLWERRPGGAPKPADPAEWVSYERSTMFWVNSARGEPFRVAFAAASAVLREWGLPVPSSKDVRARRALIDPPRLRHRRGGVL